MRLGLVICCYNALAEKPKPLLFSEAQWDIRISLSIHLLYMCKRWLFTWLWVPWSGLRTNTSPLFFLSTLYLRVFSPFLKLYITLLNKNASKGDWINLLNKLIKVSERIASFLLWTCIFLRRFPLLKLALRLCEEEMAKAFFFLLLLLSLQLAEKHRQADKPGLEYYFPVWFLFLKGSARKN